MMTPEAQQSDSEPLAGRASQPAFPSGREAQPGEAAGGVPSVTPPTITKCLGGEDWLELSLYLQHKQFARTRALLDVAREASECNRRGPDELLIAGRKFLMLPSAALAGSPGNQVVYRWRLRSEDGWWLLLMNRSDSHPTLPTGIARASSLPLLRIGPQAFLNQLHETLADLSVDLRREKLSRVDPCVDLCGIPLTPLFEAFMQGHFVSRARYSTNHIAEESFEGYRLGRRPTGFSIGKGNVRLRVYDKFNKCKTDHEMLLLMQTRRWGGVGINAIRAEFELRREKLKSLGIDSINDWWAKRGAVTHYLSHEWCRITADVVDSNHADRSPTHPEWIKVQNAFPEWTGEPVGELAPLPRLPIRADHLLQQILGAFISFHARVGTHIDNNETFAHESLSSLLDLIDQKDMSELVRRKAFEIGAPLP